MILLNPDHSRARRARTAAFNLVEAAVAMALSLPTDFPQRALLQEITFGVVLFTLFVQGTTAERVVVRVGAATGSAGPAS